MKLCRKSAASTLLTLLALFFFASGPLPRIYAQKSELYDVLFGDKDKQLKSYKNGQADLLSPGHYARAVESYAKAKEEFKKGKDTGEVRKRLAEVEASFQQIDNTLWSGKGLFDEVLKAREDALNARAP